MSGWGRWVPAATLAAAALALPATAAAAPQNDDFADSISIGSNLPAYGAGTTVGATAEPGEPGTWSGGATVWFTWTAPVTERVLIDACNTGQNGGVDDLRVFEGDSLAELRWRGDSPRSCGSYGSKARLAAIAETTYRIAVDGRSEPGSFYLAVRALERPVNDDFSAAQVLPGSLPTWALGTTADATAEDWESGYSSVWYSWTAEGDGPVKVATCTETDPMWGGREVTVYRGDDVAELAPIGEEHSNCSGGAIVRFEAEEGEAYRFEVDGLGDDQAFVLRVDGPRPPDTSIVGGPAEGAVTNEGYPKFSFASDQPAYGYECSIDGGEFRWCLEEQSFAQGYGPLSNGRHELRVRAISVDDETDPTPARRSFVVDYVPPRPPAIPQSVLDCMAAQTRRGEASVALADAKRKLKWSWGAKARRKARSRVRRARAELRKAEGQVKKDC